MQRSLSLTVPRGGGVGLAGPRERTVTARARFPGKAWARREAEADQAEERPAEQFQWAGGECGGCRIC